MKILIVEDSQDIATSLTICFKIRWPEVQLVFANLGAKAIESVKTEKPDFIILDLGLPDMDGREVLAEVRRFSNIPITVLSVRNQDSDKASCLEAGANDYITKPFSALNLMARIKATYETWKHTQNQT